MNAAPYGKPDLPKSQQAVLLAASGAAQNVIVPALTGLSATLFFAADYEEAVNAFEQHLPDLVIVTYFFDHLRAYRFIEWMQEVREEGRQFLIVLARVLPMRLPLTPQDEKLLESAYLDLGADHVFNLEAETAVVGRERALASFLVLIEQFLARARLRPKAGLKEDTNLPW